MKTLKILLSLCVCAALVTVGVQAGEFDKQVKARQSFMQILAYNNGILGAMARGKAPYDATVAQTAATNLSLAASMSNASMWPAGSDMDSQSDTVAKKDIWSTWPKAGESFGKLAKATTFLEGEAGNGVDALKAAMKDVGKTCSGCHKQFRAKR